MNKITGQILIIPLIGIFIAGIYFGSYLPFVKSKSYIAALSSGSAVKSFDDFKKVFGKPLDFYSPVGQEEVVKFLCNDILNMVSNPKQNEESMRVVINFIEPYLFQNNVRHLLKPTAPTGSLNSPLF